MARKTQLEPFSNARMPLLAQIFLYFGSIAYPLQGLYSLAKPRALVHSRANKVSQSGGAHSKL